MSKTLVEQKQRERKFLEQLLDGTKLEKYTIPVPIKAELRKYQQVSLVLPIFHWSKSVKIQKVELVV